MNIHSPNSRSVQVLDIDAGGTMTDTFFVDSDGDFVVGKAQSTPQNEVLGLIASSVDGLPLARYESDGRLSVWYGNSQKTLNPGFCPSLFRHQREDDRAWRATRAMPDPRCADRRAICDPSESEQVQCRYASNRIVQRSSLMR